MDSGDSHGADTAVFHAVRLDSLLLFLRSDLGCALRLGLDDLGSVLGDLEGVEPDHLDLVPDGSADGATVLRSLTSRRAALSR